MNIFIIYLVNNEFLFLEYITVYPGFYNYMMKTMNFQFNKNYNRQITNMVYVFDKLSIEYRFLMDYKIITTNLNCKFLNNINI